MTWGDFLTACLPVPCGYSARHGLRCSGWCTAVTGAAQAMPCGITARHRARLWHPRGRWGRAKAPRAPCRAGVPHACGTTAPHGPAGVPRSFSGRPYVTTEFSELLSRPQARKHVVRKRHAHPFLPPPAPTVRCAVLNVRPPGSQEIRGWGVPPLPVDSQISRSRRWLPG